MPQYCTSILTVRGVGVSQFDKDFKGRPVNWGLSPLEKSGLSEAQINAKLIQRIQDYMLFQEDYCLNSMVPVPLEVVGKGYMYKAGQFKGFGYGDDRRNVILGGRDWQKTYWGCADVYGNVVMLTDSIDEMSVNVRYKIISEDGYPNYWLQAVSKLYPDLSFTMEAWKHMTFAIFINAINGEITTEHVPPGKYAIYFEQKRQEELETLDSDGWPI